MDPQIRFCTSADGTRIAYAAYGDRNRPPLVSFSGWGHIMESWLTVSWGRRFLEEETRHRYVVEFDRRGTGASQRDVLDISMDAQVADLLAVVDAVDLDRFDLIGWYDGAAVSVAFSAAHASRLSRLILAAPFVAAEDSWMGSGTAQTAQMIRADWSLARRAMSTIAFPSGPNDRQRWWSRAMKEGISQDLAARYYEEFIGRIDVTSLLSHVQTPTLVLHFSEDRLSPLDASRRVATLLPDARFVPLVGEVDRFNDEFESLALSFLDEGREDRARDLPSGTAIILFADIVDSTALTERLGDAAFRDKARDLDTALRTNIRDHEGAPIEGKLLGDGVLAVFSSARQAIEAALACGRAGEEGGLPLHIGLHAGDVISEEGNVFGGSVNIAARVAGESAPGEVLVSGTVRELARTSAGVSFEDKGEHGLKGVADPQRLFAVAERLGDQLTDTKAD